jgi:hypothetical protein
MAERVDLAEQAEHLVIGGDEAETIPSSAMSSSLARGMKLLLDLVDAANEGPI